MVHRFVPAVQQHTLSTAASHEKEDSSGIHELTKNMTHTDAWTGTQDSQRTYTPVQS